MTLLHVERHKSARFVGRLDHLHSFDRSLGILLSGGLSVGAIGSVLLIASVRLVAEDGRCVLLRKRTAISGRSHRVAAATSLWAEALTKDRLIGAIAADVLRNVRLVVQGLNLLGDWTCEVKRIGFRLNHAVFLNNFF